MRHTTRSSAALALAAGLALLGAIPAAAQEPSGPNSLVPGAWSMSFDLPWGGPGGGGGGLGFWRMVSARTNLGLSLDAEHARDRLEEPFSERERTITRGALGLEARRYLVLDRPVAPFLAARVGAGLYRERADVDSAAPPLDVRGWSADAGGGVGVEWFPVRGVSLTGSTGLGVAYSRSRVPAAPEPGERKSSSVSLRTFTTSLGFQIYF